MTLVKFKNRSLLDTLANDALTGNYYDSLLGSGKDCNHHSETNYQVVENESNFELSIAVPGFDKEDLNIALNKGVLTIKSVEQENAEPRLGFGGSEIEQSFRLSKKINQDAISAKVEKGVLTVTMAKKEEEIEKPSREIEIS